MSTRYVPWRQSGGRKPAVARGQQCPGRLTGQVGDHDQRAGDRLVRHVDDRSHAAAANLRVATGAPPAGPSDTRGEQRERCAGASTRATL